MLREVDRRAHAQRQHPQERVEDNVEGVEYIRQYAYFIIEIARLCRKQLPGYARYALCEHVDYEKRRKRCRECRADERKPLHDDAVGSAVQPYNILIHSTYPSSAGN